MDDFKLNRKLVARRAYSLVELLIVIVIMGIMAGVAMPMVGNAIEERHVTASAMQIKADLEAARSYAVSTSSAQSLRFNAIAEGYTWSGMNDPDRPGRPYKIDLSADQYASELISADFGGDGDVVFDMHGMADSDGEIIVRAGALQLRVLLDGVTGEVTVKE